jgi:gluconolactonase
MATRRFENRGLTIDVANERIKDLVDESVEIEHLASGGPIDPDDPFANVHSYLPAEGPVWVPQERCLLFSDVANSRRLRWDEHSGVREVASQTNCGNGMTLDLYGRLIVCGGGASDVLRMSSDGTGADSQVIASHFGGKRLNSPNDVVVSEGGSIYFTDPLSTPPWRPDREQELDVQSVYRITVDGQIQSLRTDFQFPNGLCFSPDESILYVNDWQRHHIRAFDVASDGSLTNDRIFAKDIRDDNHAGAPDGMKCDEHGNVWVTGPHGIWIFGADGEFLGIIKIPAPRAVTNMHWGGEGWKWLYVTGFNTLYRLRTKVAGRREAFMR